MKNSLFSVCLLTLLIVLFSCRREDEIFDGTSAQLEFSTQTISFDTVFTTVGSTTQNFRVFNPYKETVRISSIRLAGGEQSNFRINVDGRPGSYHENIEIAPKDSIWIFVEATVDPNNEQNPFVIEDQIEFITNGNRQAVELVAWGQNAIYYTPTTFYQNLPDISCLNHPKPCSEKNSPMNMVWTDSLPIVIYGYVFVDSLDQLTIEKGTKVYFHNNAGMWVYSGGQLTVNGTKEEPVLFRGDRREMSYENIPGQWDRIWINEGAVHEINYAIIKNAFIGIHLEHLPFRNPIADPKNEAWKLKITNTVIDNCSGFGLFATLHNVEAENLIITDCGQYNVAIRSGGRYDFKHCTFANYYQEAERETPAFYIQNWVVNSLRQQIILEADINVYNSIIYGTLESEFDTERIDTVKIDLDFQNTIIKTDHNTSNTAQFKNIIKNPADNIFSDPTEGIFRLYSGSVAKDKGSLQIANRAPFDYDGEDRTKDGKPDLGAFEFIP